MTHKLIIEMNDSEYSRYLAGCRMVATIVKTDTPDSRPAVRFHKRRKPVAPTEGLRLPHSYTARNVDTLRMRFCIDASIGGAEAARTLLEEVQEAAQYLQEWPGSDAQEIL